MIKASTAKKVRELMVSVTEAGGTGTAGAVDGFDVGAKTGTARKLVNGRYVDNNTSVHSSVLPRLKIHA